MFGCPGGGGQGMVVVGCGEDDGAEGYNRPI